MANSTSNIDAISVSQASKEVTANAFFDSASQAATYGRRASTSSGLTWGYYGGNVVTSDGATAQIANGTLTLTASATSYIVAAKATGAVSAATTTTNWDNATDYWRLYSVVAGAETVTSWSDVRAMGAFQGSAPGGGMTNPMTTAGDMIVGGTSGTPLRLASGSDGQILTIVSGAPAWGSASGGGLTGFDSAYVTASPNGGIPVAALSASGAEASIDVAIVPKGTDSSFALSVADNTATGGAKRGARAVDLQRRRSAASNVASGTDSFTAGEDNRASGAWSIAAGYAGTATGQAAVSFGASCSASGNQSFATGNTSVASGNQAFASGSNSTSSGVCSISMGQQAIADADYSAAYGFRSNVRGVYGATAYASGVFGSTAGECQARRMVLRGATTDATAKALTTNNTTAGAANQLNLPDGSALTVKGTVIARQASTGDAKSWSFECSVQRGSGAGTTALVAACTPVVVAASAGASAWEISVAADTTYGCLSITATGEASKTIRWGASIESIEVVG